MIVDIVIIYITFICWYWFSKIKKNEELIIHNYGQALINTFIIFIIFFISLRLLNLFRDYHTLDLNNLSFDFLTTILYIILIISIRKLVMYRFKVSWFKIHYLMMCPNNFYFFERYQNVYYNIIYFPAHLSLRYLIKINYAVVLGLFLIFGYDLVFNNLVLNYTLWYLRYYSIFRVIYMCYSFTVFKQNLLLDYYSYNLLYPGTEEEEFFSSFKDVDHLNLIEESKIYNQGVIMERCNYVHKAFGNIRKMAYFKKVAKSNKI